MNELIEVAKQNESLFDKIRSLTLELLHVDGWHALNEVLATYVLADFQADFVCCHLSAYGIKLEHLLSHTDDAPYERYLSDHQPMCTALRSDELDLLFPIELHVTEGSAVLAPLRLDGVSGCLAIGSRDPSYFSSDMDTLFVSYIAEVLTRVVQRLAP